MPASKNLHKSGRRTKRRQPDLKTTKINQTFCFYEPPHRGTGSWSTGGKKLTERVIREADEGAHLLMCF
jgi:hypothetical protein